MLFRRAPIHISPDAQLEGVEIMFKALLRALAILFIISITVSAQADGPSIRLDPMVVQRSEYREKLSYTLYIENDDSLTHKFRISVI